MLSEPLSTPHGPARERIWTPRDVRRFESRARLGALAGARALVVELR
jgi:hypothetical protein